MDLLDDPLDKDDFDPIAYINKRFPTESSLDQLDGLVSQIDGQISTLDDEISRAVQSQCAMGKQTTQDVQDAQAYIEDLFSKIHDIKQKASQSENMVQDLCADIKKLDYAKTHLQTSITALNRLQMLINAVNQLEVLASDNQYRDVANLIDAVRQFMFHFEQYAHIPIIADLIKRVDSIKEQLTNHIRQIFSELASNIDTAADAELVLQSIPGGGLRAVADSCYVVDALGITTRKELLHEFVQFQLKPYDAIFGANKEYCALEHVERRWSWFKRLLKYIDSKFTNIFPVHWRLSLQITLGFFEHTKLHLIAVLTEMDSRQQLSDVNTLLKGLQSSIRFEQEMNERYQLSKELQVMKEKEDAAKKLLTKEQDMHKRILSQKLMYIPTDLSNAFDEMEYDFLQLASSCLSSGISGLFDKFLYSYVSLEKQNLSDLLARLNAEEDLSNSEYLEMMAGGGGMSHADNNSSDSANGFLYKSSSNMFVYIKNSIKRCCALTTGQTFYALSEEFRVCMRQYLAILKSRCPPEITAISSSGSTGSTTPVFRLPANGEITMCYLINTCEYCADVIPQLEQMIQGKIHPSYISKVNFSNEAEAYMDFIAYCLKILIYGSLERVDSQAFKTMQSINWGNVQSVGEESAYLHTIQHQLIYEILPHVRRILSLSYFQNVITKLATELLQRFLEIITKQKRINDIATQQLLIDTYSLKTIVLQFPQIGITTSKELFAGHGGKTITPLSKTAINMFTKLVNNKSSHIEMILKLVSTPEEVLLERFRMLWPDGSSQDLSMIMGLKGTKRNDQQVILDMLGIAAAGKMLKETTTLLATTAVSTVQHTTTNSTNTSTSSSVNSPTNSNATTTANAAGGASSNSAFSASASSAAASASAASAAAFSSMKSLTQDLSSQARNAVGNLKWSSSSTAPNK